MKLAPSLLELAYSMCVSVGGYFEGRINILLFLPYHTF